MIDVNPLLHSKKSNRYRTVFKKKFNIDICNDISKYVLVCNGGISNQINEDVLLAIFGPSKGIINLILPPLASHSIIVFDTDASAMIACTQATQCKFPDGRPVNLAFIESLPESAVNAECKLPEGLVIIEDFLTEHEETLLLDCIKFEESSQSLKQRLVKHFGYEFSYDTNSATETTEPMPQEFSFLWPRLQEATGISFIPDQCTVNKYYPGGGIPPHVDTHSAFTEVIVSVSLESGVYMEWRYEGTGPIRRVLLPRRSICVMTGESRYNWTHCIASRKYDLVPGKFDGSTTRQRSERTSLTFRRRKDGECTCSFPILCDSAIKGKQHLTCITKDDAANFEKTCVHDVYEEIADHFSETRHKPWPNVVNFLETFPEGSLILDVGCGNGKYLGCHSTAEIIGCDRSENLLALCRVRGFQVFTCDCLQIPIRDGILDGCICIAVIHHLSTEDRRKMAIQELARVLRPGGRALIYVWAKNQEEENTKSSYLKQRKKNKQTKTDSPTSYAESGNVALPVHTNRTNFQHSDMFVPWQKKTKDVDKSGPTYLRYYHVFEEKELSDLVVSLPGIECEKCYYDQGNWCVILRKI